MLATEVLIRDTADPSKAAVAARHQQERLRCDVYSHVIAQSEPANMAAPPPSDLCSWAGAILSESTCPSRALLGTHGRDGVSQDAGRAGRDQLCAEGRLCNGAFAQSIVDELVAAISTAASCLVGPMVSRKATDCCFAPTAQRSGTGIKRRFWVCIG